MEMQVSESIEKMLAIHKQEQDAYFLYDGEYYLGNEDELNVFIKETITEENEDKSFELIRNWLDDNVTPIEDYDDDNRRWLVLTDEEADKMALERSKDFFEENCSLSSDDFLYNYIDFDKAAEDAVNIDGRGQMLNPYNGEEYEQKVNGTWYFLYRK